MIEEPALHSSSIRIARTVADLRATVAVWRSTGKTIALVPTMGALHEGHLSLVQLARSKASRVVVSIFVNPAQFGPTEDFSRYPRDEAGDLAKLAPASHSPDTVDLVWAPSPDEMYPSGFATRIAPQGAALGLEGAVRPHHFVGVATVCCKLFGQVTPDFAIFGEKDYQQLCVIRQLVRDLNLRVEIVGAPTLREADGLALSSRNAYLLLEERKIAPALHRAIRSVAARIAKGSAPAEVTPGAAAEVIRAGFASVDYLEVRDAQTLAAFDPRSARPARVLAAARIGKTRLIDNVAV